MEKLIDAKRSRDAIECDEALEKAAQMTRLYEDLDRLASMSFSTHFNSESASKSSGLVTGVVISVTSVVVTIGLMVVPAVSGMFDS